MSLCLYYTQTTKFLRNLYIHLFHLAWYLILLTVVSAPYYTMQFVSNNVLSITSYTQLFISFQHGDTLHITYIYHSLHITINYKQILTCLLNFNAYFKPLNFTN